MTEYIKIFLIMLTVILCFMLIVKTIASIPDKMKLNEKKITILALHLGYGGIERYLASLCKMLIEDYDIEIIATYKILEKPAFEFDSKVKIKYLMNDGPNRAELHRAIKDKKILGIIKECLKSISILYKKRTLNIKAIKKIDSKYIITTRDFHNELVGTYASKNIIKIATEHNYHNNNKKYIKKVINSVKKIDYFVLVSENLKNFYEDKVVPKCLYIPNVIDELPNRFSNNNNHTLISVGRLSKEKGQQDLLDVIKLIKTDFPDIKLYLIGDGIEKNNLTNYIRLNNLDKNVILTGFLSKNDIELKMLESSIFVTTSYTESFGLVIIEACSYKLPVVAFDSATGVKTLLQNNCGILVSNRDKTAMKNEIEKLFKDEKYKNNIANNGYNNCKKFLAKNVRKMWLEILK